MQAETTAARPVNINARRFMRCLSPIIAICRGGCAPGSRRLRAREETRYAVSMTVNPETLSPLPLPAGIRSRMVPNINGLTMHVLEAGFETQERPTVLLLHGFPEIAYSWRK